MSPAIRAAEAPPSRNLGRLFAGHAASSRIAAIDLSTPQPRKVTYRELNETCDAVAKAAVERGLTIGDRVAILSLNSADYIAATLGVLRAGLVPVPVNIKLAAGSVHEIMRSAEVRLAFADSPFRHLIPGDVEVIALAHSLSDTLEPGRVDTIEAGPKTVSMQFYTAGTTGRPKGVLLTHSGQLWAADILAEHRRISPEERMLLSAPFFHKNAIVAIKTALRVGACLVILPRFTAAAALHAILDHSCTTITGVPTMMHLLLAEMARQRLQEIRSVHTISMGSAPASPSLLAALSKAFPEAAIHLNYGTTEGGPICFGWFHPEGKPRPIDSIGYPLPECELRFVGGPHEREGELWVRNPGLALGYHKLPEETSRKFVDGWYRTGDILRQDADGWCYFVGRVDDMFVCGGENIHPQEVEVLIEKHPEVKQAVVLSFPHEAKGEVPYAFVVRRPGSNVDEAAVKAFALENGPAYAHPRRVIFVEEIPLTGANKVDRAALRALCEPSQTPTESNNA